MGVETITLVANSPTAKAVKFSIAYTSVPMVLTTAIATVPGTSVSGDEAEISQYQDLMPISQETVPQTHLWVGCLLDIKLHKKRRGQHGNQHCSSYHRSDYPYGMPDKQSLSIQGNNEPDRI